MMTVLTKYVYIEDEEFVLVRGMYQDQQYFGTIPYSEIDEEGKMRRELTGSDICISFLSAGEAIEKRKWQLRMKRFRSSGYTKEELDEFFDKALPYLN